MRQATSKTTDPMWRSAGRATTRDYAERRVAGPAGHGVAAGPAAAPATGRRRPRRPCREIRVDPKMIARLEAHYARPKAERRSPTLARRLWLRLLGSPEH